MANANPLLVYVKMGEREIRHFKYGREMIPTLLAESDTCRLLIITDDQIEVLRNLINYAHDRKNWNDETINSDTYYMPSDDDWDILKALVDDTEDKLMSACDFVTLDEANDRLGINNDSPDAALDVVGNPIAELHDATGAYGLNLSASEAAFTIGGLIDLNGNEIVLDAVNITLKAAGVEMAKITHISEGVEEFQVHGITFPATQVPSANPNTLDDYQWGTAVVSFVPGTSGTITLQNASKTLAYTKIGRLVCCTGRLEVASVSSPVGSLTLTGLPFTCANAQEFFAPVEVRGSALAATAVTQLVGTMIINTTTLRIDRFAAGVATTTMASDVLAGSVFTISFFYFSA